MGVIQYPVQLTGTVGFNPNLRYMITSDNLATITAPGYLNNTNKIDATPLSNTDVVLAIYSYNPQTTMGTFGIFTVSLNSSNGITLTQWTDAGGNAMLVNAQNVMTSIGSIVAHKVNGTEAANLVTANGMAGTITTSALTTAAGSSYSIAWTNSFITSTSSVMLMLGSGTNTVFDLTIECSPGNSSTIITIYNNSATAALNGTIVLNYLVM